MMRLNLQGWYVRIGYLISLSLSLKLKSIKQQTKQVLVSNIVAVHYLAILI